MSQYFLNSLQFDNAKLWHQSALKKLDQVLFQGKGDLFNLSSSQVDEAVTRMLDKRLHCGSIPENLECFAAQFQELNISFENAATVQQMILELAKHTESMKKIMNGYSK